MGIPKRIRRRQRHWLSWLLKSTPNRRRRKVTHSPPSFFMLLLLVVASWGLVFLFADSLLHTPAPRAFISTNRDPNLGVESEVRSYLTLNDADALVPIIACESHFRQYESDGTPLKNREGSSAVGVAQILTSKHPDPMVLRVYNLRHNTNLTVNDFDITTLDDNLSYALILYDVRGVRDWACAH